MENGANAISFADYCNMCNESYNDRNCTHYFSMLEVLKDKFLNKTMELQDFDEEVRKLLFVDDDGSIYMSNISDSIHNGFHYDTLCCDATGYDFFFEFVIHDPVEQEIYIKVADILEC